MRLILLLMLVIIFIPKASQALTCWRPEGKELIKQYDLIFKGKSTETLATKSSPNSKTGFEIYEVIKGPNLKRVDIYHSIQKLLSGPMISGMTREFEPETKYIIFANFRKDKNFYSVGGCSPTWKVSQIKNFKYSFYTDALAEMEKYQSFKRGLNDLIENYDLEDHYIEKAKLHEEYGDYTQAKSIYESLAEKAYQTAKENTTNHFITQVRLEDVEPCPEAIETAPRFVKEMKPSVPHDGYNDARKYALAYGRTLYNLDDYQGALRSFCLAGNNEEALKLYMQTHMQLGLTDYIETQQINLSDVKLRDIILTNLNLHKPKFLESALYNIRFDGSDMSAADFSDSKLTSIGFRGANLQGANFSKATLNNVDFAYANVKGIDFSSVEMDERTLKSFQLTSDSFNSDTIWPDGVSVKGHTLVFENAN